MARYFFHFHDGTDQPDLTGTELASSNDARDAAVVFMGKKLKDLDGNFWPEGLWSIRRGRDRRDRLHNPSHW